MVSRRALIYLFALACTAVGLRWAFVRDDKPSDDAAGGGGGTLQAKGPTSRMPGELGGYRGTGKPQITLEGETRPVAAPARPKDHGEVRLPQMSEGDRRRAELKRVLDNLDGEPVYVEGVDGPAPEKKQKSKQ